jgi:hypothetical protein
MNMPNDPEKPIENALQAYARKRRAEAGPPLQLHPATRKLLQAEVARRWPARSREPGAWLKIVEAWWPRFAFAAAIFVGLGIVCWNLLWSARRPMDVAKVEQRELEDRNKIEAGGQLRPTAAPTPGAPALAFEAKGSATRVAEAGQAELPVALAESLARTPAPLAQAPSQQPTADASSVKLAKAIDSSARRSQVSLDASPLALADGATAADMKRKLAPEPTGAAHVPPSTTDLNFTTWAAAGTTLQAAQATNFFYLTAGTAMSEPTQGRAFFFDAQNGGAGGGWSQTVPSLNYRADFPPTNAAVPMLALNQGQAPMTVTASYSTSVRYGISGPKSVATEPVILGRAAQTGFVAAKRERFVQAADPAQSRRVRGLTELLTSFELERNGQRVRIVDSDGSIYEGRWLASTPAQRALFEKLREADAADRRLRTTQPLAQEENAREALAVAGARRDAVFRLTGTNRSSKQVVLIEARLDEVADQAAEDAVATPQPSPTSAIPALAPELAAKPKPGVVRVLGRAFVGTNEIELNAVCLPPK